MIVYIAVSVFLLMIAYFIYSGYKNEKRYQEDRKERADKRQEKIKNRGVPSSRKVTAPSSKEEKEEELLPAVSPKTETVQKREEKAEPSPKPSIEPTPEIPREAPQKEIPVSLGKYPDFNHARLLKMGLSEEDAQEFVAELIPQIESQIPLIEEAMERSDFHTMERLTHSIKGSSTTVGSGGVSDLLVDFNTYLKSGTEPAIAEAYLKQLKHYCQALKEQYSR